MERIEKDGHQRNIERRRIDKMNRRKMERRKIDGKKKVKRQISDDKQVEMWRGKDMMERRNKNGRKTMVE